MIELEALAVAWATSKSTQDLMGLSSFNLVVDHRPLVPIFNSYALYAIENPPLQLIVGKLTPYNFTTT